MRFLKKSGDVSSRIRIMFAASVLSTIVTVSLLSLMERKETTQRESVQDCKIDIVLRDQHKEEKKEKVENKQLENVDNEVQEQEKNKQEEKEEVKDYTSRTIEELRQKTGLDVIGFEEYTFELSFYSDLNCENGYGNLTANGEILSEGMIANNFLDFNTKIYMEGYGTKRVTDRGSKKYFNAVNKVDVFVPRKNGELDSEYYRRVNNMGRKNTKGYILKLAEG